jgi:hypothetical protein
MFETISADGYYIVAHKWVMLPESPRVGDALIFTDHRPGALILKVASVRVFVEPDQTYWQLNVDLEIKPDGTQRILGALDNHGFELYGAPSLEPADEPRKRRPLSPKVRFEVLDRANYRCNACGRSPADGVKLHVDHIVPVSKGGDDDIENLQCLCEECNLGKGAG